MNPIEIPKYFPSQTKYIPRKLLSESYQQVANAENGKQEFSEFKQLVASQSYYKRLAHTLFESHHELEKLKNLTDTMFSHYKTKTQMLEDRVEELEKEIEDLTQPSLEEAINITEMGIRSFIQNQEKKNYQFSESELEEYGDLDQYGITKEEFIEFKTHQELFGKMTCARLTQLLDQDRENLERVFAKRFQISRKIAEEHPTLQVGAHETSKRLYLRVLGVLNSVVGCDSNRNGYIASYEEDGRISKFAKFAYWEEGRGYPGQSNQT